MRTPKILTTATACTLLLLAGCGGDGGDRAAAFTTQIFSDPALDGDIQQTDPTSFVVTQGMSATVQSVFAGIDPGTQTEFRAFLTFPLTGSNGVPLDARIDSAFLELFVDDLQPQAAHLPLLIELVSFQPPTLLASDYDRTAQPALAAIHVTPPIAAGDIGTLVPIDVTPLMVQAQRLGLADFQIRIMEDLGPPIVGRMEIDDTTGSNRSQVGPLLTVTYF